MPRFNVTYQFHGHATESIEADSLDAARDLVAASVDAPGFHIEADSIDAVTYAVREMHPVTRDGIWSRHPAP